MIKTEAIILKSADLGETDRLLTIYSKKLGKVNILAKGSKKLQSKLRCHIEPLSHSHLILVEGKSFLILKDAVLMDQFLWIKKDLNKVNLAYKIINIIEQLIVGEEGDESVWDLILRGFKELEVQHFQDDLLRLMGYDPKQIKSLADIY